MRQTFLISDEHYYHGGIITECGRPFRDVNQMNMTMIQNNNDTVNDDDDVWHIGDLCWGTKYEQLENIMKKLRGRHHLVLGNHDDFKPFTYIKAGFITVHTAMWLDHSPETFVLAHDPSIYTFCKKELGTFVHGHVHDLYETIPGKSVVNVSVEVTGYRPLSLEEVYERAKST